ncbi:allophanate hydrolase [Acuticoccus mangrovi]|uniref:Allophanate hydrolase n=1 Tax=Acuticoccus mangrovi TaxID=2796142 RepID=A0A934IN37_9HYPH|nr:allophanate hydrolase [Acuticoccus mangrovi]MBJ3775491.1 allophanate hydrolase [Acuticoccus mangrovi]
MSETTVDTLSFDAASLATAYAGGLAPADVIREVYRRIAAAGDPGIFLHLVPEEVAVAEAEALGAYDPAVPLWGLPFAIKDNIDLAGSPTTAACPAFAYTAERDAVVVAALRVAGAIPIGKTNLDQFATGLVGVRTPYPVPKNALDPALPPGGSSSGSAVAVARGLVTFALGTDTAGSGRVPAFLNNIVGLKPTLGSLSAGGMVPACRTLDTISVFAGTVEDAYAVTRVAAVFDPDDAYARPVPMPALGARPPKVRLGVPDAATLDVGGDTDQKAAFEAALDRLRGLGAEIVPLDFTALFETAKLVYGGPWVAERYAAIAEVIAERPEVLHPVTRKVIGAAETMSAADAFRGLYHLKALKRLTDPLIASVDALVVPTIPTLATVADLEADPIGPNSMFGTYTNFVNLLDLCAIAVPAGKRGDGHAFGVCFVAPAGKDGFLASLAGPLHRLTTAEIGATGHPVPPAPEPAAAAPGPDELAIAVVGAHMSGLPLNRELSGRGGRFLFAAETAPVYRFYRLAGGPPMRPGLVRVGEGGATIALEVWALPRAAMGDFISGVPSPLSIGTLQLADGTAVLGFLCESAGLDGAQDISAHGGWRPFLAAEAS